MSHIVLSTNFNNVLNISNYETFLFTVTANGDICMDDASCSDRNAYCFKGRCTCLSDYYDNNGFLFGGDCFHVDRLKVSGITFESVNTTHSNVLWTPSPVASNFVDEYEVFWRVKDNSMDGDSITKGTLSRSAVIPNLVPGKAYVVYIKAVNQQTDRDSERSTFDYTEIGSSTYKHYNAPIALYLVF